MTSTLNAVVFYLPYIWIEQIAPDQKHSIWDKQQVGKDSSGRVSKATQRMQSCCFDWLGLSGFRSARKTGRPVWFSWKEEVMAVWAMSLISHSLGHPGSGIELIIPSAVDAEIRSDGLNRARALMTGRRAWSAGSLTCSWNLRSSWKDPFSGRCD